MTETWYEAKFYDPTTFKAVEVAAHTDKAVTLADGRRRQKVSQGGIIARSRSHLKSLLIAHFERELNKYQSWASYNRQRIEQLKAVSDD